MDYSFLICLLCLPPASPFHPLPPNSSYLVLISVCVPVQIYSATLSCARVCGAAGSVLCSRGRPEPSAGSRLYISLRKHTRSTAASGRPARTVSELFSGGYISSAVSPPGAASAAARTLSQLELQRSRGCPTSRT